MLVSPFQTVIWYELSISYDKVIAREHAKYTKKLTVILHVVVADEAK